jgi:superfamily II DNA or RNA helicase
MNTALESYCAGKPLRPYQAEAVAAVEAHLQRGRITLLVAPTGAGKSRMSAGLMLPALRGLVLTHTTILREQSKATLPGVSVATIQSLIGKGEQAAYRREKLKLFDRFFVDEAHHLVGPEWVQLVPYMKHGHLFGATATPQRADGTPLGDVFEQMVVAARYSDLVNDGYLCPCDVAKPKLSRAQQRKMKVKVDGVQSYLDHGRREGTENEWRPGIYFAPTISECESASERFNNLGIRSRVVSCEITGTERQAIFDAYSSGQLDMLCSPMALSEGFDSPRAEVCVLCRSAASVANFIQIVGRILRPAPGKERALLIDCTDAVSAHGLPTADRVYSLHGEAMSIEVPLEEQEKQQREAAEREAWQLVRVEYELVRDRLKGRHASLRQEAIDHGYKRGWVFQQFKALTGVETPLIVTAVKLSTCAHCRTRVKLDSQILRTRKDIGHGYNFFHQDCWFETLNDEQLSSFKALLAQKENQ